MNTYPEAPAFGSAVLLSLRLRSVRVAGPELLPLDIAVSSKREREKDNFLGRFDIMWQ